MRDPQRAIDVHRLGPHSCTPEQSLPAQLRLHGVRPEDVNILILTHLHYDHAETARSFPTRALSSSAPS